MNKDAFRFYIQTYISSQQKPVWLYLVSDEIHYPDVRFPLVLLISFFLMQMDMVPDIVKSSTVDHDRDLIDERAIDREVVCII